MPNTTRWYEIAGNFSPHFTRTYLFLRQFPLVRYAHLWKLSSKQIHTRIMRSKISGNFVPSRCITNDNTYNYITFLIYNAKISDNNAESGKVPRILAAFPR
jgi:hypothetical protein